MKNSLKILFVLAAFAGSAVASYAAEANKIAIVDMRYLFENHYKTVEQYAKLQKEQERMKADIDRLNKEGQALQQEAKSLADQLANTALTADAKATLEAKQKAKNEELQRKANDISTLARRNSDELNQSMKLFSERLYREISDTAVKVTKNRGFSMLFDKSAPLLYCEDSMEITEDVLKEINKSNPGSTPQP